MKILLVDPPYQRIIGYYRFYFPLGLTSIAAVLKQAGHEVIICDLEHDPSCISPSMNDTAAMHLKYKDALNNNQHPIWSEYLQVLDSFKPDIVGVSVLSVKVFSAIKIATLTKKYNNQIIVIAGGDHVTVRPHDVLTGFVDYVICGEGEYGVLFLANSILAGTDIPRILYTSRVDNLDVLPYPEIDCLMNLSTYRPIDLGLMMTERGCPYQCSFCALSTIWGNKVRNHSIQRVIREIKLRKQKYNTNFFSFRNGTFTLMPSRVNEFCCNIVKEGLEIDWECLTRIDTVEDRILSCMKQAGCKTIRVGIESGSDKILKYINKNISLHQIRIASKILHQSGIFWSAYFILGVPMETEETMNETLMLIKEIDPPFVTLARFTPLPGTPLYREVVDNGLLDDKQTDWTWGANQSLDQAFVKNMKQERFLALMKEAALFVKEHNARHALNFSDPRLI